MIKYGDEGNISFSTKGKLISNINRPVFEIDGKIVVDPPYSYRFEKIPKGISDYPYINCVIQSKSKQADYHLSYITTGLDWSAEYNLHLLSNSTCNIEGWYSIRNDLSLQYKDADIYLVSGEVNFEYSTRGTAHANKRTQTSISYRSDIAPPIITETGEYAIFHLPEKINLAPKSQVRYQFVSTNKISYETIYHISHSLQRYRRNTDAKSQNIPVYVRLELQADNIGDFQLPSGSYRVYEQKEGNLAYIGIGTSGISEGTDSL